MAINSTWTTSFPPLTCLTTCPERNFLLWDSEATQKGHAQGPETHTLRLQRGGIRVRTRGDLTNVVWMDKRDVCLLTNIHDSPREGNYRNEHGNSIKPVIVADYNRQMCHVDNADRMANSYTANRRT